MQSSFSGLGIREFTPQEEKGKLANVDVIIEQTNRFWK